MLNCNSRLRFFVFGQPSIFLEINSSCHLRSSESSIFFLLNGPLFSTVPSSFSRAMRILKAESSLRSSAYFFFASCGLECRHRLRFFLCYIQSSSGSPIVIRHRFFYLMFIHFPLSEDSRSESSIFCPSMPSATVGRYSHLLPKHQKACMEKLESIYHPADA